MYAIKEEQAMFVVYKNYKKIGEYQTEEQAKQFVFKISSYSQL